jgi:hypothetical protein
LWPGLSPAGRALTGVTVVDDLDKAIAASIAANRRGDHSGRFLWCRAMPDEAAKPRMQRAVRIARKA